MSTKLYNRFKRLTIISVAALAMVSIGLPGTTRALTPSGSSGPSTTTTTPSVVKATPQNMPTIGLNGLLTDLNFTVNSLNQACNEMFAGGRFVMAYSANGKTSYPRKGIFAFNETTGAMNTSFKPALAGASVTVYSVLPTTDGKSVFIGGDFTSVDGVSSTGYLVKYNLTTNKVDATFKGRVNGQVNSMVMWNGKLVVGGDFTSAGGLSETALAALDPTTGTNTGYFSKIVVAGSQPSATAGVTRVKTIAISPTATVDANSGANLQHLVMAGNWNTVGGLVRGQVAMLSLNTAPVVSAWDSTMLHDLADPRFGNYLRGVSFLPDGSAFFLAASGGYWGTTGPNDALTRFEMKVTGALVVPTWMNKTGGDSLWTVVATQNAIYVTGHERWTNNPQGINAAGPGAISRPGIGAIDPKTGMALSWNPNRSRYVGGEALLITPAGLWVGSDGPNLGCTTPGGPNHDDCTGLPLQSHPGIGFLPY